MKTASWRRSPNARRVPGIVAGAVLMLALLCLLEILTAANFRKLAEANRWNTHTYQVLEQISEFSVALDQQESRLRGFALTGDLDLLDKAQESETAGLRALRNLGTLTRDNPEQQNRVQAFTTNYQSWLANFTFIDREQLNGAAARIRTETPPRRASLDYLREQIQGIESSERALLEMRSRQQMISQQNTAKLLLGASICTVVLVAFAVWMLGLQAQALTKTINQLHHNREQLQTVLDNAPLILYAVDAEEKFTLLVGRGLEKVGLDGEKSIGRPVTEVIGADYEGVQTIRAALRGQSSVSVTQFRGKIFESHRRPVRDGENISGMTGVALDITDRFEAENALRESEARYRSVVEGVQEVIFQVDAHGLWTFLNPAWRILLGHNIVSSLGHPCLEFIYPEDHEAFQECFDALAKGSSPICRSLIRFATRSGAPRWMDTQIQAQHDVNGQFLGVAGTLNDITDRKLAQEELLGVMTLQKAILNSANYTIIACTEHGVIQSFNRAAQEMLGYSAEEMCGKKTPLVLHDEKEVAAIAEQLSEELGEKIEPGFDVFTAKPRRGITDEREWSYIRRDGSRVPVRLSISAFYGAGGEVTGYVGIGYDLTESRRAEKLKNEFVSVVSHELRTPLTSIRGALGLLAGGVAGALPDSARQMIDIAQKNSDRLVLLINDILDIEKIESGKMRFDSRPLAVRELIESAVEQNRAYAEALGVKLVFEGGEALELLQIMGDENRLQQVLSNLLSNAAKFTPTGGTVHVSAQLKGFSALDATESATDRGAEVPRIAAAASPAVRIIVRDEGPGVPEEFVPRLFEKFAQADSSSTRQQGGTGLGLAIARAIIEKHGGIIDYLPPSGTEDDKPGATFFFELPVDVPLVTGQSVPLFKDQAGRVLICEDNPDVANILRMMMSHNGYEADIVSTAEAARDKLAHHRYIGMTLDLVLPDGDGLELLAELRANEQTRTLPVVVVTGHAHLGQLQGEAFGVIDWLCKPVDAQRLLAAMNQFRGTARPHVLHVEDDVDVRRVMAAILRDSADVVEAATLREARACLETGHFDLVILDIGLPDGSGLDLVPLFSESEPPVPVILFSASEASHDQANVVAASLVKSRTDNDALRATIQRFLNGHNG